MRGFLMIPAAIVLCACTRGGNGSNSGDPPTICSTAGQTCLFEPGKLGLCVQRTGPCTGTGCLVCQSQH